MALLNRVIQRPIIAFTVIIFLVSALYSQHFDNPFHFDDSHTIEDNPAITRLDNIPSFFKDGTTFSILPANQSYRPLLTTSLAIDYWIGNGLNPIIFHVTSFVLYLVTLCFLFFLLRSLFHTFVTIDETRLLAFLGCLWFGVHPASAETVNYLIQRGELIACLSILVSFTLYIVFPVTHGYYLYLLPLIAGGFSKPTALMFAPLLLAYMVLIERKLPFDGTLAYFESRSTTAILRRWAPTLFVTIVLHLFLQYKTPGSFTPGGSSLWHYLITQPYVHSYYFYTFFIPTSLCVDTDISLVQSLFDLRVFIGALFYVVLISTIYLCHSRANTGLVAFGLSWFIISHIPTTVIPLAEVMNNHRMFLPNIGLVIAGLAGGRELFKVLLHKFERRQLLLRVVVIAATLSSLMLYSAATWQRNIVWGSDESLWLDTISKCPANGRSQMNYALSQMERGKYEVAETHLTRALSFSPHYPYLHVNLGIVYGARGKMSEADGAFKRALSLAPNLQISNYFYSRWLFQTNRYVDALVFARRAHELSPRDLRALILQLQIYLATGDSSSFDTLLPTALELAPQDNRLKLLLQQRHLENEQRFTSLIATSLELFNSGRFAECIKLTQEILAQSPKYLAAYVNNGACHAALGNWDAAIASAQAALTIDPKFELAINNLRWAEAQRKLGLVAGRASKR